LEGIFTLQKKAMENLKRNLLGSANEKLREILENARNLAGLGENDFRVLADRKEILLSWTDELAEDFYQTLLNYPKTAKIFEKVPVEKVKEKFKAWYRNLIAGGGGEEFYRQQFFIGLVHIYHQIDNNVMIFMANNLKRNFLKKLFEHFEPEEAIYVFQAFSKLVDFVIALTVEGYIFTLYQALTDVAGLRPTLVERMMKLKLEEIYNLFKREFLKPTA
jgi:hypothetical protein